MKITHVLTAFRSNVKFFWITIWFGLLLVALFYILSVPSCSNSSNPTSSGGGGTQVAVTLTDYHISMSTTLTAGLTTFNVMNAGNTIHSFEIQGNGIDKALSSTLNPGSSGSLTVTLTVGSYRIFCPVDSHAAMGMTTQVTVNQPSSSTGGY